MRSLFKKKVNADSEDVPVTLGEKILDVLIFILGVVILTILGFLIYLITGHTNPVIEKKFTYTCESKKEQVKNTNDGVIFIEKYGFELPYQITKFKNKENR